MLTHHVQEAKVVASCQPFAFVLGKTHGGRLVANMVISMMQHSESVLVTGTRSVAKIRRMVASRKAFIAFHALLP